MPTGEFIERWTGIGQILGLIIIGILTAWLKAYLEGRSSERAKGEIPAKIVAQSVGAAFVDRTTADVLAKMGHDVAEILKILIRREDHDEREEIVEEARRKILADIKAGKSVPGD